MPKVERLKTRPEFLRVALKGRKWATPGLVLQALQRSSGEIGDTSSVRVGFTASRKVGSAVERNRARRRLRAAVAEVLPEAASPGTDYVVIARGGTLERGYAELLADLRAALVKVAGPTDGKARGHSHGGTLVYSTKL